MKSLAEDLNKKIPRACMTNIEVAAIMGGAGTPDSRYGQVKRLIAQDRLIHLRRGLYAIQGRSDLINPFAVSQYIYGPSCISLESALAWHNLIPEAAYAITNVCTKRSKNFSTPIGEFNFYKTPLENFYTEVILVNENNQQFLVAKPWRAICDYVYCYKKDWESYAPLLKSLRMNIENLPVVTTEDIDLLLEYYQHSRISRFLKGIKKESWAKQNKELTR